MGVSSPYCQTLKKFVLFLDDAIKYSSISGIYSGYILITRKFLYLTREPRHYRIGLILPCREFRDCHDAFDRLFHYDIRLGSLLRCSTSGMPQSI